VATSTAGSLFADDATSLRRLALMLYGLVTPVFCAVLALESAAPFRLPAVAAAMTLCVSGGVWLVLRPRMGTADWIFVGVGVPIVGCGVAFWATGASGPAYFAVMGAPIAWAAVLFDGPVVAAGIVLAITTSLVTLTPQIGLLGAITNTLVFGAIYGLVGGVAYWKAGTLRILRDEVMASSGRINALMDALPDTIIRTDRLGRFLEVHAPSDTPLPMPAGELTGRPVYEFLPQDAREPMQAAITAAVDTGLPQRIEYDISHLDGWQRFEARIVRAGADEIVIVRQDIADRVRADERAQFVAHLVETMDEAVTTVDLLGVVTTWSPGAQRVYGWSAAEAIGRSITELVTPAEDRQQAREDFDRVLWAESVRETAVRVRKDGRRITVDGSFSVIPGPDGEASGILGVTRDITALQVERDRIAVSEGLHRATVAALAEGLVVFDAAGQVVTANAAVREIMGLTADQLTGREPVPDGWTALADDGLTPARAEDLVARLSAAGATQGEVGAFRHADGSVVWIRANAQPLIGPDNAPAGIVVTFLDITEERRTHQDELEQARLESLEQRMNDAELVMRLDGTLIQANDRALRLYGYTREAISSLNIRDLRALDTRPSVGGQMAQAVEGGTRFETVHRRSDGVEFPVEVSSRGFESGGVRYLHSLVRDLTEVRRAEAERRALEAAVTESEERLRTIVSAMSEGIVVQAADGKVLLCNEAAQEMMALTREQIEDPSLRDPAWCSFQEDGAPFVPELRPRRVALRTGEAQHRVLMGVQPPARDLRWVSVNAEPLRRAPGEMPYAVVSTFADVTGLHESERRYRTLFENMQEDITVYRVARDADGRPVDWILAEANAEGRRFFGDAYEASIGKTTTELGYGEQMRHAVARSDEYTSGLVTAHDTVHFAPTDVWYLSAVFAIDSETIVDVVMDISERVRAEERLRVALDENERTEVELRQALTDVRTLSGLLPICMSCKKIRNDEGYRDRIEQYLADHTDAMPSHGMCPDCHEAYAMPDVEVLKQAPR
jgi:PAS domain S-box-containing protein